MFILRTACLTCYILTYVDDIIITYSDPTALVTFIRQLGVASFIKDLGNLIFFFLALNSYLFPTIAIEATLYLGPSL